MGAQVVNFLFLIDKLDPISRFQTIIKEKNEIFDEGVVRLSDLILVALFVIDEVIKSSFNISNYIYVYNDNSVKALLSKVVNEKELNTQFKNSLILIDLSKFIYRFSCAKKFMINDGSIQQLRINSWGREYLILMDLIDQYKNEYNTMKKYYSEYVKNNKDNYLCILNHLSKNIELFDAQIINRTNNFLNIKLLS